MKHSEVRYDIGGGTIYIAGKMRGEHQYNFPKFDAARDRLTKLGWKVISPADIDRKAGFDEKVYHSEHEIQSMMPTFLKRDICALIDQCNAIAMLDGWRSSVGAKIELSIAKALGYKIYNEYGEGIEG